MALSNYEKQKRWRDKNRALYNFQQRQRRKKNLPVPVLAEPKPKRDGRPGVSELAEQSNVVGSGEARESTQTGRTRATIGVSRDGQTSSSPTIQALRELITKESERPVETPVAVPTVFKDDYGRVISEAQWKKLQGRKEKAKAGGYELDPYTQI